MAAKGAAFKDGKPLSTRKVGDATVTDPPRDFMGNTIKRPGQEVSAQFDAQERGEYKHQLDLAMDHLVSMVGKSQQDLEDSSTTDTVAFAFGRIAGAVELVQRLVNRLP
jgi:hypothetical protein